LLNLLNQYILVWQLPVALLIASLAILPIRNAYRKARIGDLNILDHGAVAQTFFATLWVGIASIIYPYVIVLMLGVWIAFYRRRLMTLRTWMASLLSLTMCAFWWLIIHYFFLK